MPLSMRIEDENNKKEDEHPDEEVRVLLHPEMEEEHLCGGEEKSHTSEPLSGNLS